MGDDAIYRKQFWTWVVLLGKNFFTWVIGLLDLEKGAEPLTHSYCDIFTIFITYFIWDTFFRENFVGEVLSGEFCRGIGIPRFVTALSGMILDRLTAKLESTSAAVRDAFNHPTVSLPMK